MADKEWVWRMPMPAPEFVMVPKLVRTEILPHLTGAEFKVFYCLLTAAYEWGRGVADLSIKEIVDQAGVGRGTAQDAVRELVRVGLVTVEARTSAEHGNEANMYRVLVTDDPRYVDRHPIPKTGTAGRENIHSFPGERAPSRARSSYRKNKREEERSIHQERITDQSDPDYYRQGKYGHLVE